MKILFIHQNFPGQFRQIAPYLQSLGHDVRAICSHNRPVDISCPIYRYCEPAPLQSSLPGLGSALWVDGLQRAESVAKICYQLHSEGWLPDRICVHSGWGESLAIRDLWPQIPQIVWPELWLQPIHGGYGIDPFKPPDDFHSRLLQLGRNQLTRAALSQASSWILPTIYQANSFPPEFQTPNLHVIHEGIDTEIACPNPNIEFVVRDFTINRSVPTITFVNRNLERLRGFDSFIRALPLIQNQHPDVRILIVGDDKPGYGGEPPSKSSLLAQFGSSLDLSRIYFLGRIPYDQLIALFQVSWIHVYLTYPFILGWSLLEAMSCGCCVVGSRGYPVEEVIVDGYDGVLTPIDDSIMLAKRILMLLQSNDYRSTLGVNARTSSLKWDKKLLLPQIASVIQHSS